MRGLAVLPLLPVWRVGRGREKRAGVMRVLGGGLRGKARPIPPAPRVFRQVFREASRPRLGSLRVAQSSGSLPPLAYSTAKAAGLDSSMPATATGFQGWTETRPPR